MSAQHRAWLFDQAQAHALRNPNPAAKAAAQKVRETLKTQRQARDISNQKKDQA